MRHEGQEMEMDERRMTRDEKVFKKASVVRVSRANGRPSSLVVVLIALSMLLSSCGYGFTHVGGIVPEDTKTIAIPTFINGTTEPYVDVEVTKAVVNEFLTDGRLKVVSAETADLVLTGKVTKFEVIPAAYTTDNYVSSYQVIMGISVSVEDMRTHKYILQDSSVGSIFNAGYPVTLSTSTGVSTVDITATKIAKESALKSTSRDVASSLRSRLLEGF